MRLEWKLLATVKNILFSRLLPVILTSQVISFMDYHFIFAQLLPCTKGLISLKTVRLLANGGTLREIEKSVFDGLWGVFPRPDVLV